MWIPWRRTILMWKSDEQSWCAMPGTDEPWCEILMCNFDVPSWCGFLMWNHDAESWCEFLLWRNWQMFPARFQLFDIEMFWWDNSYHILCPQFESQYPPPHAINHKMTNNYATTNKFNKLTVDWIPPPLTTMCWQPKWHNVFAVLSICWFTIWTPPSPAALYRRSQNYTSPLSQCFIHIHLVVHKQNFTNRMIPWFLPICGVDNFNQNICCHAS